MFALIPILVAIAVLEYAFPMTLMERLLVLVVAGVVASVVQLRYVPLVRK